MSVLHAITWRRVGSTQGIVLLAVLLESCQYPLLGTWLGHPSMQYVAMSLSALALLPLMLYADEQVNRGAAARRVYPAAVATAVALVFAITGATEEGFYLAVRLPRAVAAAHRWVFLSTALDIALICSFGMVIYMNRRTAERVLEGIQGAELQRVQLERQLLESRLATAEAEVDPRMLFGALAEIREGFNRAGLEGDIKLDGLVQQLRGALARTVSAGNADAGSP